jgi:hypothetical protein
MPICQVKCCYKLLTAYTSLSAVLYTVNYKLTIKSQGGNQSDVTSLYVLMAATVCSAPVTLFHTCKSPLLAS